MKSMLSITGILVLLWMHFISCYANPQADAEWEYDNTLQPGHWRIAGDALDPSAPNPMCYFDTDKEATLGVTCCDEETGTTASRPGCKKNVVYAQAKAHCESVGKMLCSQEQLYQGAGRGTGCGFDAIRVWTRSDCEFYPKDSGVFEKPTPKPTNKPTLRPTPSVSHKIKSFSNGNYEECIFNFDKKSNENKNIGVACCGNANASPKKESMACQTASNYFEAMQYCDYIGLRLCSTSEISSNSAKKCPSASGFDMIWTKSECKKGDTAVPDAPKNGHIVLIDGEAKCAKHGEKEIDNQPVGVCCCTANRRRLQPGNHRPTTKPPTTKPPTSPREYSIKSLTKNKNYNEAVSACNNNNGMVLCSPKQLRHRASNCEYRTEPVWTNVACRTQYDLDEAMRTKKEACSVSEAPEFKLVEEEGNMFDEVDTSAGGLFKAAHEAMGPVVSIGASILGAGGAKAKVAGIAINAIHQLAGLAIGVTEEEEVDPMIKVEEAFEEMGDYVEGELESVYECMGMLEEEVEDAFKKDEAEEFAKVVRASMEATKNKWDTMEHHKQAILVDLNNAWSYFINYPVPTTDEQTLALMMPAFKELATFYHTELPIYLGSATAFCETGMSNAESGCGYSPTNDGCCYDYQYILQFEEGRMPQILAWIYNVRDKLKSTYQSWVDDGEIKRWEANFVEAHIELLEDLKKEIGELPGHITSQPSSSPTRRPTMPTSEPTKPLTYGGWIKGETASTCDKTCGARGLVCNADEQSKITSCAALATIQKAVGATWGGCRGHRGYAGSPAANGYYMTPGRKSVCNKNANRGFQPLCYCSTSKLVSSAHGNAFDDHDGDNNDNVFDEPSFDHDVSNKPNRIWISEKYAYLIGMALLVPVLLCAVFGVWKFSAFAKKTKYAPVSVMSETENENEI